MATKGKKDFSQAFGFGNVEETKVEDVSKEKIEEVKEEVKQETQPSSLKEETTREGWEEVIQQTEPQEEKQIIEAQQTQTVVEVNNNNQNVVVTYANPMQNLERKYAVLLEQIREEENNVLRGFMKRAPQSEVYANVTIQVRRDLYGCICEYITEMRMGKTKVLNEIFMLGINEFIKKYSVKNKE